MIVNIDKLIKKRINDNFFSLVSNYIFFDYITSIDELSLLLNKLMKTIDRYSSNTNFQNTIVYLFFNILKKYCYSEYDEKIEYNLIKYFDIVNNKCQNQELKLKILFLYFLFFNYSIYVRKSFKYRDKRIPDICFYLIETFIINYKISEIISSFSKNEYVFKEILSYIINILNNTYIVYYIDKLNDKNEIENYFDRLIDLSTNINNILCYNSKSKDESLIFLDRLISDKRDFIKFNEKIKNIQLKKSTNFSFLKQDYINFIVIEFISYFVIINSFFKKYDITFSASTFLKKILKRYIVNKNNYVLFLESDYHLTPFLYEENINFFNNEIIFNKNQIKEIINLDKFFSVDNIRTAFTIISHFNIISQINFYFIYKEYLSEKQFDLEYYKQAINILINIYFQKEIKKLFMSLLLLKIIKFNITNEENILRTYVSQFANSGFLIIKILKQIEIDEIVYRNIKQIFFYLVTSITNDQIILLYYLIVEISKNNKLKSILNDFWVIIFDKIKLFIDDKDNSITKKTIIFNKCKKLYIKNYQKDIKSFKINYIKNIEIHTNFLEYILYNIFYVILKDLINYIKNIGEVDKLEINELLFYEKDNYNYFCQNISDLIFYLFFEPNKPLLESYRFDMLINQVNSFFSKLVCLNLHISFVNELNKEIKHFILLLCQYITLHRLSQTTSLLDSNEKKVFFNLILYAIYNSKKLNEYLMSRKEDIKGFKLRKDISLNEKEKTPLKTKLLCFKEDSLKDKDFIFNYDIKII